MNKWLALVKLLAPIILTTVKPELAPIAGNITDAIGEAEQIKGATGQEKLAHVKNIAVSTANSINTAKGKTVIDPTSLTGAIDQSVSTVVSVVNLIHEKTDSSLAQVK